MVSWGVAHSPMCSLQLLPGCRCQKGFPNVALEVCPLTNCWGWGKSRGQKRIAIPIHSCSHQPQTIVLLRSPLRPSGPMLWFTVDRQGPVWQNMEQWSSWVPAELHVVKRALYEPQGSYARAGSDLKGNNLLYISKERERERERERESALHLWPQ